MTAAAETTEVTPDSLFQIASGFMAAKHLFVADAMVALGLLAREGDRYQNGAVAATFLSGATLADLRPFLRFWDRLSFPTWTNFEAAVRTGEGQSTLSLPAEEQRIFSE